MTPKAAKHGRATGTSFKGVFAYLQHDKRHEGETVRTTTERVDWQEFRNLMTDNTDNAWRIMRATANQQDNLKRTAGNSTAGNKSDQVVFHYSLGWHPDETGNLTKDEMLRAADESLQAIGAQDHQVAIIAHNDTKHPHVHLVINRVHPNDGKMLNLWNYKKNLSKWALGYEKERGTIYCEQREMNWKRRELGEKVFAEKSTPHHLQDQAQALGHANDNDLRKLLREQKAKDSALAAYGENMRQRHSNDWKSYSKSYKAGKADILEKKAGHPSPYQQATATIKDNYTPLHRQLNRAQWKETKDFEKREKRLIGKLANAVKAAIADRRLSYEEKQGVQTNYFNYLVSSDARREALERVHNGQKRKLRGEEKKQAQLARDRVKAGIDKRLTAHRKEFEVRRYDLKTRHAVEQADYRDKWLQRTEERRMLVNVVDQHQTNQQQEKPSQERENGLTAGDLRKTFKKSRKEGRKRRKRKRKPD